MRPLLAILLVAASAAIAEEPAPAAATPEPAVADLTDAELVWRVYATLSASCADCHGGHRKPKGDFGYVLDLRRLVDEGLYVVPGEPAHSDLYLLLVEPDPDLLMPPVDAEVPPLEPEQIAEIHEWIRRGAPLAFGGGEPVAGEGGGEDAVPVDGNGEIAGGFSLRRLFGHLHPLAVHLPIALLMAAAAAGAVHRLRPRPWSDGALVWCLWGGALGAIAAVATGWVDAGVEGYSDATVFVHRWTGVGTAVAAAVAAALDVVGRVRGAWRLQTIAFWLLLVSVLLVVIAGHNGGTLVHGDDYLW